MTKQAARKNLIRDLAIRAGWDCGRVTRDFVGGCVQPENATMHQYCDVAFGGPELLSHAKTDALIRDVHAFINF